MMSETRDGQRYYDTSAPPNMDVEGIKKLAQLIIDIESVAKDLKKRRIHPLDILPIEMPHRLAQRLDDAIKNFNDV